MFDDGKLDDRKKLGNTQLCRFWYWSKYLYLHTLMKADSERVI